MATNEEYKCSTPNQHGIWIVLALAVLLMATFVPTTSKLSNYSAIVWKDDVEQLQGLAKSTAPILSDPSIILKGLIQSNYPECQLSTTSINLATMGMYVKATDTHLLYDHVSCFVMKARYNCAYRPDAPFDMAHKYELVLRFPNHTKDCRLKALIMDTLNQWRRLSTSQDSQDKVNVKVQRHHVFLQGNSYVRQLWEALVCNIVSFQQPTLQIPITDFRVQFGGPGIAMQDFAARRNRPVETDELGSPISNMSHVQIAGCHGEANADLSPYFRRKAVVPPNLANCNDNVAMIEIAHQWRFYYIFKPTMYSPKTLEHIYRQRFDISQDNIDDDKFWLLWNSVLKEPQNVTAAYLPSFTRQLSIESWLWTLRDLQLRDLNRYFGANNPWISKPPDFHACMPGTPDDQVNLLLYLLWTEYHME